MVYIDTTVAMALLIHNNAENIAIQSIFIVSYYNIFCKYMRASMHNARPYAINITIFVMLK